MTGSLIKLTAIATASLTAGMLLIANPVLGNGDNTAGELQKPVAESSMTREDRMLKLQQIRKSSNLRNLRHETELQEAELRSARLQILRNASILAKEIGRAHV